MAETLTQYQNSIIATMFDINGVENDLIWVTGVSKKIEDQGKPSQLEFHALVAIGYIHHKHGIWRLTEAGLNYRQLLRL